MTDTSPPAERDARGRFGPGNPGRRAGARNRMSHRVVMEILEDFESNRDQMLYRLRQHHSAAYFAVLVRLLDRQLQIDAVPFEDIADAELDTALLHRINGV